MNGEILQHCKIVIGAKKALRENTEIIFEPAKYENSISFNFIPKKSLFQNKEYTAGDVNKWFSACKDKRLTDIKLLSPISVKDRSLLGFANSDQSCIVCFYNNKVTYFTAERSFNNIRKKWDILYTERLWENPPKEKTIFRNNTLPFKLILEQIRDFAETINFKGFSETFQKSADILNGDIKPDGSEEYYYALIPEENAKLLRAADNCDVFGAMGSWNDSPPYAAYKMGLEKEYDELSDKLFQEMTKAILYSVNEW